jgi:hypothetical protein
VDQIAGTSVGTAAEQESIGKLTIDGGMAAAGALKTS